MANETVVIIIPTYNEALVIAETLTEIFRVTTNISGKTIHVLVFDSQSTDNTAAIVRQLQHTFPRLYLQSEPEKTGLGSAYLQAMNYALSELSADIVIEFDADGSHQPKYLKPMLGLINTCDVVVGSRYIPGGSIPKNWGWHRQFLSILGNAIARLVLTSKTRDFTSGFRATRRKALLKALPQQFISNQYAYKLQLQWQLIQQQATVCEYPIEFIDRSKGTSKLPANSIIDSLRVLALLRLQKAKTYLNMCLVGLSGVLLQALIYNVLRQNIPPVNAAQCAVFAAMINNFALNHRFTFKTRSRKTQSFGLYIAYSMVMIIVQSYWLSLGIQLLGQGAFKENLIMMVGIVAGSVVNYITYSRWIWRSDARA